MTLAERIERSFAADGFAFVSASLAGTEVRVGRRSRFRLRWLASRLHVFVVIVVYGEDATNSDLEALERDGVAYAITHKGGIPRGLQTGTATVTVAIIQDGEAFLDWALVPRAPEFAALSYPVLVDVRRRSTHRPPGLELGRLYASFLADLSDTHVGAVVAAG